LKNTGHGKGTIVKNKQPDRRYLQAAVLLAAFILSGCAKPAAFCPTQPLADLSGALAFADDAQLPYRFPLDDLGGSMDPFPARFCSSGGRDSSRMYHAAEDYHLPAGTPVFAFADGVVSFSGRMGGYGWLVIIDHPQANIYSLYGHLSPSRWSIGRVPVAKGDLIGYLGDPDENGGSASKPLVTHLHFGIRAGQQSDYPGRGEWRWMAGWIKPCPADLGWLRPSAVMTGQLLPPAGALVPSAGLVETWGVELGLAGAYLAGAVASAVLGLRKQNPILPGLYGVMMFAVGWLMQVKGTRISWVLFATAGVLLVLALVLYLKRSRESNPSVNSRES